MKNYVQAAIVAIAATVGASAVSADVPVYYTEGNKRLFSFELPDFWVLLSGGDRTLAAPGTENNRRVSRVIGMEPEGTGGVWLGFVVPDGVTTRAQAYAYLDEVGTSLVRNPQETKSVNRSIAGRPAVVTSGTGSVGNERVQYTAVVVDLPGSKFAIGVTIVEPDATPTQIDQLNQIFDSIRVAR